MDRIRRILVAIRDPHDPNPVPIRRAGELARALGASVELFHALAEPRTVTRRIQGRRIAQSLSVEHSVAAAQHDLERLARARAFAGCRVSVAAVWDAPAHEAVVRRTLASHAGLVILGAPTHGLGTRLILRSTDWELIRTCPVPLLLAKSRASRRRAVLAAVDPLHANAKPARLDARLLDAAAAMARLRKGAVHVVHAYMPLNFAVPSAFGEPSAWENAQAEQIHARNVELEFTRLASRAHIPPARCHLRLGSVAGEVAATARAIRAWMVVVGAVSRSRLTQWVIGSAAERVLDALECDALIIKPDQARRRRAVAGSRRPRPRSAAARRSAE
jgi:universal stress protein E